MDPSRTNRLLVDWMIMVRDASIYLSAEYCAKPVRKGPRRDPIAMLMAALPGI